MCFLILSFIIYWDINSISESCRVETSGGTTGCPSPKYFLSLSPPISLKIISNEYNFTTFDNFHIKNRNENDKAILSSQTYIVCSQPAVDHVLVTLSNLIHCFLGKNKSQIQERWVLFVHSFSYYQVHSENNYLIYVSSKVVFSFHTSILHQTQTLQLLIN